MSQPGTSVRAPPSEYPTWQLCAEQLTLPGTETSWQRVSWRRADQLGNLKAIGNEPSARARSKFLPSCGVLLPKPQMLAKSFSSFFAVASCASLGWAQSEASALQMWSKQIRRGASARRKPRESSPGTFRTATGREHGSLHGWIFMHGKKPLECKACQASAAGAAAFDSDPAVNAMEVRSTTMDRAKLRQN